MKLTRRQQGVMFVVFGVALYFGLRIYAISSDGYKFLDQAIRRSSEVQTRLGDIEAVRLSYIGHWRERASGPNTWVTMTLNVTGRKGAATIDASAKNISGNWSVTSSSIDGEPIDLK